MSGKRANSEWKQCPDCAEDVRLAARRCRFCGYDFAKTTARRDEHASTGRSHHIDEASSSESDEPQPKDPPSSLAGDYVAWVALPPVALFVLINVVGGEAGRRAYEKPISALALLWFGLAILTWVLERPYASSALRYWRAISVAAFIVALVSFIGSAPLEDRISSTAPSGGAHAETGSTDTRAWSAEKYCDEVDAETSILGQQIMEDLWKVGTMRGDDLDLLMSRIADGAQFYLEALEEMRPPEQLAETHTRIIAESREFDDLMNHPDEGVRPLYWAQESGDTRAAYFAQFYDYLFSVRDEMLPNHRKLACD